MKNTYHNLEVLEFLEQVEKSGTRVELILTDPPYNISQKSTTNLPDGHKFNIDFGSWDYNFDQVSWLTKLKNVVTENGSVLIFNSWRNIGIMIETLEKNGFIVKDVLFWLKPNQFPRARDRRYLQNFENVLWAVLKNSKWTFNRHWKTPFLSPIFHSTAEHKNRTHATQKPLKVLKELIRIHSNEGDTILDCFAGSGSTGVSAVHENRNYILNELDKKYFELGKKWVKKESGQQKFRFTEKLSPPQKQKFLISRDGKTILEQPRAKENYNGTSTPRVEK